jgi:glycogen operon protein
LALSLGVPMLLGGDEIGRTQRGDNNAYCQDNDISWYDWANVDPDLLAWARSLFNLRRNHPVFRRRRFFHGRPLRQVDTDPALADIGWFRPDGHLMTDQDWGVGYAKSLAVLFNGRSPVGADRHGRHVADTSFYLALNAWEQPLDFKLPARRWGGPWQVVVDTSDDKPVYKPALVAAGGALPLLGHHFVVLQQSAGV